MGSDFIYKNFSQTFTGIDLFGYGGNDQTLLSRTLTLPTDVTEGNGNNIIGLGSGNDVVTLGSGSNVVYGGNGNDWRGSWATGPTPSLSAKATIRSRRATATTVSPSATAMTSSSSAMVPT